MKFLKRVVRNPESVSFAGGMGRSEVGSTKDINRANMNIAGVRDRVPKSACKVRKWVKRVKRM